MCHVSCQINNMVAPKNVLVSLFVQSFLLFSYVSAVKYEPTWASIDSRPLPSWYDEAKLGIFVHWGVFSVPSFSSEWFWHDWQMSKLPGIAEWMQENFKPDFTYADFAKDFSTEFYEADQWAEIFNSSGARYIVFVSKHHEGYTNWPSKYSYTWNAMDLGPNRDLVGELADAVRNQYPNLHFGLYHSQYEWFHPLYQQDKANNFTTNDFVKFKTLPEWYEIVNRYKPEIIWSDGDGEAPDHYWQSKEFIAWLYNDSPVKDTVVVNDRWGKGIGCVHGGFFTCGDRFNPGHLFKHKWENAMTIDQYSWGYRRNARLKDYLSIETLLDTFIKTVSCGGNMLMNVGPRHDGIIDPLMQERLRQMGEWLGVNGEAIYSTKPWTYQNDTVNPNVWYTNKTTGGETTVYAIVLKWPTGNNITLGSPFPSEQTTVVSMLGYNSGAKFSWKPSGSQGMVITIPPIYELPCQWAWVFKLEGLLQKPRNPAHPVYLPKFDTYRRIGKDYKPVVTVN